MTSIEDQVAACKVKWSNQYSGALQYNKKNKTLSCYGVSNDDGSKALFPVLKQITFNWNYQPLETVSFTVTEEFSDHFVEIMLPI